MRGDVPLSLGLGLPNLPSQNQTSCCNVTMETTTINYSLTGINVQNRLKYKSNDATTEVVFGTKHTNT